MVDDPRPPIKKVQFVQFSDASTESAPFIYFDEVLPLASTRVISASNSALAPSFQRRTVRRKQFMS